MSSGDETPTFANSAEEVKYWKLKAGEWKKSSKRCQRGIG